MARNMPEFSKPHETSVLRMSAARTTHSGRLSASPESTASPSSLSDLSRESK